jgi:hypothetical protein
MKGWSALALLAVTGIAIAAGDATPVFDGKTLNGWKVLGGTAEYRVVDGAIVGSTRHEKDNTFLATDANFTDFVLEYDVRQDVGPANSGVQFRSASKPAFQNGRVHGYQADIDPTDKAWSGGIYEEAQRGWFYTGDMNPPGKSLYRYGEWNHFRIEAIGPRLRTWINGKPASDVKDDGHASGFVALQIHSVNTAEEAGRTTSWKNVTVQTKNLRRAPPMGIFIRNTLPNDLDAEEKSQGWKLLWDGKTAKGWRSARGGAFPATGWTVANGELAVGAKSGAGDIMTDAQFGAFELQMEFKTTEGANSGIFYLLTAAHDPASGAPLGLEYQVLDDEKHPDAKQGVDGNRTIASLYDIFPRDKLRGNVGVKPVVGAWQHARIVSRKDGSVEHWLNGVKVLEFNRHSDAYRAKVAQSKFKATPKFGEAERGHILLQDHGDAVSFRSIKIREL